MTGLHWSARYVGIPSRDHGRDRDGCDCWGLVRLVYADELGIRLPGYDETYVSTEEHAAIGAAIAGRPDAWFEVHRPAAYDVRLYRIGAHPCHVALHVGGGRMLHVTRGDAAKIEPTDSPVWEHRLVGIYRYREDAR